LAGGPVSDQTPCWVVLVPASPPCCGFWLGLRSLPTDVFFWRGRILPICHLMSVPSI
jgi:hypothetical protein